MAAILQDDDIIESAGKKYMIVTFKNQQVAEDKYGNKSYLVIKDNEVFIGELLPGQFVKIEKVIHPELEVEQQPNYFPKVGETTIKNGKKYTVIEAKTYTYGGIRTDKYWEDKEDNRYEITSGSTKKETIGKLV